MTIGEVHPPLFREKNDRVSLRRLIVRNYKSVGYADIELRDLTILVGRNGAGKSNFLDALRFVVDGLQMSLEHAIQSRGGIDEVRRRSTGHPRNVGIRLEWQLPDFRKAIYEFEIAARPQGAFAVKRERLDITNAAADAIAHYTVEEGVVSAGSAAQFPPGSPDRLYLVTAASLPEFQETYEAMRSMGFYNLNPEAMKELQSPDAGELLHRDGANIASVVARLKRDCPEIIDRINQYLELIVPDVSGFDRVGLGPKETLQFRQAVKGAKNPWKFYAANMSDGTLRALGALTAVMQLAKRKRPVRLVGIEVPETALHPAAAGALMDALREASARTQVIITSHSPDLIDKMNAGDDALLVVESRQGTTHISPPDKASAEAIKTHLYSPGELLRMDQLEAVTNTGSAKDEQLDLPHENARDHES